MNKLMLIAIAAVLLVGCGGSKSFIEIISNPLTWIAILPFLDLVLTAVLSFVIIIVGHFLVKFLFTKNKDEKIEELKAEGK